MWLEESWGHSWWAPIGRMTQEPVLTWQRSSQITKISGNISKRHFKQIVETWTTLKVWNPWEPLIWRRHCSDMRKVLQSFPFRNSIRGLQRRWGECWEMCWLAEGTAALPKPHPVPTPLIYFKEQQSSFQEGSSVKPEVWELRKSNGGHL